MPRYIAAFAIIVLLAVGSSTFAQVPRPEPSAARDVTAHLCCLSWSFGPHAQWEATERFVKGGPRSLHYMLQPQPGQPVSPICEGTLDPPLETMGYRALGLWVYTEKPGGNPLIPVRCRLLGADGSATSAFLTGLVAGQYSYCQVPLPGPRNTPLKAARFAVANDDFAAAGAVAADALSFFVSGIELIRPQPVAIAPTAVKLDALWSTPDPQVDFGPGAFTIPLRLRIATGAQVGFDGRETIRVNFREVFSGAEGSIERPVGVALQPGTTVEVNVPLSSDDIGTKPGFYSVTLDLHRGAASFCGPLVASAEFTIRKTAPATN